MWSMEVYSLIRSVPRTEVIGCAPLCRLAFKIRPIELIEMRTRTWVHLDPLLCTFTFELKLKGNSCTQKIMLMQEWNTVSLVNKVRADIEMSIVATVLVLCGITCISADAKHNVDVANKTEYLNRKIKSCIYTVSWTRKHSIYDRKLFIHLFNFKRKW